MALVRVTHTLPSVLKFIRPFSRRARALPRGYELSPVGSLARIHHAGATVTVTPAMQRKLAVITGVTPPAVGKRLVIPARPVVADNAMARKVATGVARHIITGKPHGAERAIKSGVLAQFDTGGSSENPWKRSRPWGKFRPADPNPLGGSGGQVARGWARGKVVER